MSRAFQIWTASWSSALPDGFVRVGISRGVPRRIRGYLRYRGLEPGVWFHEASEEVFTGRYLAEVLSRLDPHDLVRDLELRSGGRPVALSCWEQVGKGWCHRGLAAWWIGRHTGMLVQEVGHEGAGLGHPMLPQSGEARTLLQSA